MPVYFLQVRTWDKKEVWEEVDDVIFDNAEKCVTKDGGPRYTGNYLVKWDNGNIDLKLLDGIDNSLVYLARLMGVTQAAMGNICANGRGYYNKPEYVKMKRGKGFHIHENFCHSPAVKTVEDGQK